MPSFDIVSKIDPQEVENAINNTQRALATRYDFRETNTEVEFNKKESSISMRTSDTMKLTALQEMLSGNLVKRGIDPKAVKYSEPEATSKGGVKCSAQLLEGIDKETAKKIVKMIKETKLKLQAQIQDDQVRVTGKKIDDLQTIIKMVNDKDLDVPLQHVNMKS